MSNNNSGKVEDIFPTWFKKVQVTFLGELPLSQDERQQVFVVPYALFENAIEAYISSKVNEEVIKELGSLLAEEESNGIGFRSAVRSDEIRDRIRTLKEKK